MSLVVNLYGGPGTGKSTNASYLHSRLKRRGINAELIAEEAKTKTWEENYVALSNQFAISGNQYHREFIAFNKADVLVTDAPLIMGLIYCKEDRLYKHLEALLLDIHKNRTSINVFINRSKPYEPVGRSQTEDEARQKDLDAKNLLDKHKIQYITLDDRDEDFDELASFIKFTHFKD